MKKAYCDNCKKETEVKNEIMNYQFSLAISNGKYAYLSLEFCTKHVSQMKGIIDLCNDCRWLIIERALKEEANGIEENKK